ncbi:hypothetical protein FKV75_03765 [Weissella paramesenteroides]|uniref:hypothetical protein n=1 Tax=Weissella paramesenteroides TaxID=1249 RepID=UPI001238445E|nr:hypothetical protein [Weissella paramesenteroides]KAA8440455.1 hypothetical protein FKV77_08240 [Weissella paramesenteroides]KAA8440954.1 hypothetical protein FKV81_04740 [Weissella paramesenteroides]KAA8443385.1 hypothetical protein FKV75_03765 [Weissella paramesenteroides]KAA8447674.1 hypothetical protein FKV76_03985 [Weissella paramesenteroides]KAA8449723.1 hypothetical protein FKV74_05930 [Weissella paramesenteroides]
MFGMMMLILAEHWYQIVLSWIAVMLTILVLAKYGEMIWKIIQGLVLMICWLPIFLVAGQERADAIKPKKVADDID